MDRVAGAAYGINWISEDLLPTLLDRGDESWANVELLQVETPEPGPPPESGDDELSVRLVSGGYIRLDRRACTATYVVPVRLDGEELAHPYLAPTASMFSVWLGREAYHAGAFAFRDGALAVVGDRRGGKSTTLAWLAAHDVPVLSDDLVVLDSGSVLPGPRCVDLRASSAAKLDLGEPLPSVRAGGRWRMRLGRARPARLRGWVFLAWGPRIEVRPLRPSERFDLILRLGRPANAAAPLTLAEVPAWQLVRPQEWASLPDALDRLFDALSSEPRAL
jgi:hypothetical protein